MKTNYTVLSIFLFVFIGNLYSQDSWPYYLGPNSNHATALPSGTKNIIKTSEIDYLWKSEDNPGRAACDGEPGYQGGSASPIVADGKVFQSHFIPKGPISDEVYDHRKEPGNEYDQYIDADDVVFAINPVDGTTIWKKTFSSKGANLWFGHKTSTNNQTPAYYDGKVFTMGSTFRIYCLDANNGNLLWESTQHPLHSVLEGRKSSALSTKNRALTNRAVNSALTIADGVLIVPENDLNAGENDIYGFDITSGNRIWTLSNAVGIASTPAVWNTGTKEYLVCGNSSGTLRLVNPLNGNVIATVSGLGAMDYSIVVHLDNVFVKSSDDKVACYQVSESGFSFKWKIDAYTYPFGKQGIHPLGDKVHIRYDGMVAEANLSDGSINRTITADFESDDESYSMIAGNMMFAQIDGQHCATAFQLIDLENYTFVGSWYPQNHYSTTSYSVSMAHPVANGVMYIRGGDGIYAYKINKDCTQEQVISFDSIPDKLPGNSDFQLNASSTSGLDVLFEVIYGSEVASVTGNTISLSGQEGVVEIKAYQPGNSTVCEAYEVFRGFSVGDANILIPQNLTATVKSSSEVFLQWDDVSDRETSYIIQSKTEGGSWEVISENSPNDTTFAHINLTQGETYYYRVYTEVHGVKSQSSDEVTATTFAQNINIYFEAECGIVGSKWDIISDLGSSNGEYVKHPDGIDYDKVDLVDSSTWIEIKFNVPVQGNYVLWSYSRGYGGSFNSFHWKMDDFGFWGSAGMATEWQWVKNDHAFENFPAGEHILYIGLRENKTELDKFLLTTSDQTPSGIDDPAINCGEGEAPKTPGNLVAELSGFDVTLTWVDSSDNEDGFKIEKKDQYGTYSTLGTVDADVTTYTDYNVSSGQTYFYRVSAYNLFGDSEYSNQDYVQTTISDISNTKSSFKVYPNPTHGKLIVETDNIIQVKVYNLCGEMIMVDKSNNELDLSSFPKGMYFVEAGKHIFKIVKE
jgi:hypothetical protein